LSYKNNWVRTELDGDWKLAFIKNSKYVYEPKVMSDLEQNFTCIAAKVPGNFELDLQRAGIIEDLYFGKNVLDIQKYESCHMFYGRKFFYNRTNDMEPILIFEGLDTIADIYINGEMIGRSENMFITQKFVVDKLINGENEILIHIYPPCIEARKNKVSAFNRALDYNYETLRLRKSASMFGWDIMPRIVSGGIFRPVYIENKPAECIEQAYLMTEKIDTQNRTANLSLFYDLNISADNLSSYTIEVSGICGENSFTLEKRLWFTAGRLDVFVENAHFWWPKNHGDPELYNIAIQLKHNSHVIDKVVDTLGIRIVRLERTASTNSQLDGKFQFFVNEEKIFILGTNFVPIDALHSRDRERLPKVMELLDDSGCNAIRLWGGGIYENDYLYDRCDELGILIWQDFCLACGIYPIDEEFQRVMKNEAEIIVRRLRQHPSIMVWAGDNECDQMVGFDNFRKDPNMNIITRTIFKNVVDFEDPTRPYIPSSPFIEDEKEYYHTKYLTEDHLWGPRDYFKTNFYQKSVCNFASEIGYHGCVSKESMQKFISKDSLWPWKNNEEWLVHASGMEVSPNGSYAYRIELMGKQIKELFGSIPDNLEDYIIASQISQAEAKKFFIEMFRVNQPQRTGIIWWNLIDGWPQFSDAVVDYFFDKKLAYYYIKNVQQNVVITMKEPKDFATEIVAINNSGKAQKATYMVREWDTKRVVSQRTIVLEKGVQKLDAIPFSYGEKKIYTIEWSCEKFSGRNHYLSGMPPFNLKSYKVFLKSYYMDMIGSLKIE
jgi:beta-mannosidase